MSDNDEPVNHNSLDLIAKARAERYKIGLDKAVFASLGGDDKHAKLIAKYVDRFSANFKQELQDCHGRQVDLDNGKAQ